MKYLVSGSLAIVLAVMAFLAVDLDPEQADAETAVAASSETDSGSGDDMQNEQPGEVNGAIVD